MDNEGCYPENLKKRGVCWLNCLLNFESQFNPSITTLFNDDICKNWMLIFLKIKSHDWKGQGCEHTNWSGSS